MEAERCAVADAMGSRTVYMIDPNGILLYTVVTSIVWQYFEFLSPTSTRDRL